MQDYLFFVWPETDDKEIRRVREIACLPLPSSTFHTSHSNRLLRAGVVDAGSSIAKRLDHVVGGSMFETFPGHIWLVGDALRMEDRFLDPGTRNQR